MCTSELVRQRANEEFVLRTEWFTAAEVLRQATYNNGQVLALSGPRSPYKGKLGVIEEGALADLLLINGNPLEDISILTRPEQNLALIMKDGGDLQGPDRRQRTQDGPVAMPAEIRMKLHTLLPRLGRTSDDAVLSPTRAVSCHLYKGGISRRICGPNARC